MGAASALAQAPILPELRQQERERALREQLEHDERRRPKAAEPPALGRLPADEVPCHRLDTITLHGQDSEDFQWLLSHIDGENGDDSPIGRCLGAQGINTVLARMGRALVSRGWGATQVLAPVSGIQNGILPLKLLPGRAVALRFAEKGSEPTSLRNAIPIDPCALIRLEDAREDLDIIGGTVDAESSLVAQAGHDLNVQSTTRGATSTSGASDTSRTSLDRIAGLYVSNPNGVLLAGAGNDVNLVAAVLSNTGQGGHTAIHAARDLHLATVSTSVKQNAIANAGNHLRTRESEEVGSTVSAEGSISMSAGRDASLRAADVRAAQGNLLITAGRDIALEAGRQTSAVDGKTTGTSRGLFSRTTTTGTEQAERDLALGSSLGAGGLAYLDAGRNLQAEGATVSGHEGVLMRADGTLNILEARETFSGVHETSTKKSGFSPSLGGIPLPTSSADRTTTSTRADTASASRITSAEGGVLLEGGRAVNLQGVQAEAKEDLTIRGGDVNIRAATDYTSNSTEHATRSTNLGAALGHDPGKGFNARRTDMDALQASALQRSRLVGGNVRIEATGDGENGPDAKGGTLTGVNAEQINIASQAGANAAANNFLAHDENQARKKAIVACESGDQTACAERDAWNARDRARDDRLRSACNANGASQLCGDWIRFAKAVEATYRTTPDNAALRDELRFGMYSDAAERTQLQRLINGTPHASPMSPQAEAVLGQLAGIALDLTPVVGDIKGFVDAETPFDYTLAAIGALGPAGDAAKLLIREAKALLEAGDAAGAAAKVADAQSAIRATVGAKGSWDRVLNGQLMPKATYELSNGHKYMTDASGRVNKVEGKLSLDMMDRNGYQQCATGKCGAANDEGGHLIAASLGGAGDRINIVPQAATLNRGDWRAMEDEFRKALKEGKTVVVNIDVGYPVGAGTRPNSFFVEATIDGKPWSKEFMQ